MSYKCSLFSRMISRFLSLFWGHARAHFTHWNWYLTSAKSLRWEALHIGGSMWAGQRGWLESPEVHSLLRSRESFAECESLGSALGPFYSEISRLPALGDLKYHLFGHVWGRLANPAAPPHGIPNSKENCYCFAMGNLMARAESHATSCQRQL